MAFDKRKSLQSALAFTQQGKWDKAIAEYQAILRADPHDLTVCNNLGDLYARVGKATEAIELYLRLGELYRADGLAVKAIAVYKKIMKLDPARTAAHVACADLYEEQGLTGEAKIQLATAADHYGRIGDTAKVIEIYRRLTALDPTSYVVLKKLADLFFKVGKRGEAASHYRLAAEAASAAGQEAESKRLLAKLREFSPESSQTPQPRGEQLLREGKFAEAAEVLRKTTASDGRNAKAWRLLGEAYVGLRQGPEALAALKKAVGLGVPEAEVRRPMVKALILGGNPDEGVALCQQFTEDALGQGRADEAVALCEEILAAAPNLTSIHASLVRLLRDLGREEEAREAARALAEAHEACGETEAAIHVYHQLLERHPSDAEAKARLEALESAPALVEQEEVAIPMLDAGPAAAEEPSVPELSLETAPSLGEGTALEVADRFGAEGRPGQGFELDESGELVGFHRPPEGWSGAAAAGSVGVEAAAIDLPGEGAGADRPGPEAAGEDGGTPAEIAEPLAEAEVYLKYGLAERARERLLEVVRIAPDHLAAHRQLKALYMEQPQVEEACGEILAIAQILHARGQREAAQRELQEGLGLVPDHPALQGLLAELSGRGRAAPRPSGPRVGPVAAAKGPAGKPGVEDARAARPGSFQDGDVPSELRDLLEESGEEAGLTAAQDGTEADQAMAEDMAEADFYLSQGMVEEARAVYQRMHGRDASHPAVAKLEGQLGLPAGVETSGPVEPGSRDAATARAPGQAPATDLGSGKFPVRGGGGGADAGDFVNLGAELERELAAEETVAPSGAPVADDLLREFQKGAREPLDEKDFETHYNLGIAYKEMELYDEAIQEFRLAGRDPGRTLACADLLGNSFVAKGDVAAAIREFRKGLEVRGHPKKAYHRLRYDLGLAYETQGELQRALEAFEVLQAEEAPFRDLPARVKDLRDRLQQLQVAAVPVSSGDAGEPAKRGKEKKKISFI